MRRLVWTLLFLSATTGVSGFTVTVSNSDVRVKENEGVDLVCSYSADFGTDARLEWKFKDKKGSQMYVVYNGKLTEPYSSRVTLYGGSNLRFSKVTRLDNGEYTCDVSSSSSSQNAFGTVQLVVLVPPSIPMCRIPPSVTTGTRTRLSCFDENGSPTPTYRWYKDGTLLPTDPSKNAAFKNSTYVLNAGSGFLEFPSIAKTDSGEYYCEAVNDAGPAQKCKAMRMEVRDVNTGGIVAGVIVALLLLGLLIAGVWYANKKGYLPKMGESKSKSDTAYQPTTLYHGANGDDTDFKQKSSFVV